MNLPRQSPRTARANVLLVALIILGLSGMTAASTLFLVGQLNRQVARKQAWNECLVVSESGIEDGMSHLNQVGLKGLNSNDWTEDNGTFRLTRQLRNNRYSVSIVTNQPITMTSTGYVTAPYMTDQYIERVVQVIVTNVSGVFYGLVAKNQITLGGGTLVDSFDSTDPNLSTGGQYDSAKRRDKAKVASTSQGTDVITGTSNGSIYGHIGTGPGATINIGNYSIGSETWVDGSNPGVEDGYYTDDVNLYIPEIEEPFNSGYLVPGGETIDGEYYNYVLHDGNYQLSSLNMQASQKMLITGDAVLYVTGDISLTGSSSIIVASGANFNLYTSGSNVSLAGDGVINKTGSAQNFSLWGLPSTSLVKYAGAADFIGTIYAPQADFAQTGSADIYGALVAENIKLGGQGAMHYDEGIDKDAGGANYIINSWREI